MTIKHLFFVAVMSIAASANAQLSAFINGKEIKKGATVSKKDLASLQIGFKNPKKVTIVSGASVLYVGLMDSKNKMIQQWFIQNDGYIEIEEFYTNPPANRKFKVFNSDEFRNPGNTLDWIFTSAAGKEEQKNLQVKVGFYVVKETGYKEYGPQQQLLEPLTFTVPVWDSKNLTLPFLDLSIDKSAVPGDIDTKQNGRSDDERTTIGYALRGPNLWYTAYALNSDKHPGLNAKEVADDFIHAAATYANYNQLIDKKNRFKNYDIEKFTLPWDDMNDLLEAKIRISQLSYRVNKAAKEADLMPLFEQVTVNGMKGYLFKSKTEEREHINADKWTDKGNFIIYILEHPTNPKLTLVVSCSVENNKNTMEETDTFLKNFINSIKK